VLKTSDLGVKEVTKKEIKNYYESGCKGKISTLKIGLEYERLPIFEVTGKNTDYSGEFGICNLLRRYAREENWDYITDDYNIIGLKQAHNTITLEPGCQFEYSLEPRENISEIEAEIKRLDLPLEEITEEFGIKLLNYGVSPLVTYRAINLIPKHRYKIMAKYLWGILSDVMMRETAGFQCCIDYRDEADMARKFTLANKIVPFVTALCANSPIRGGVDTGYKSFRALSWLNTDSERCGYALNLDEEFDFDKYIDKILKTPVIFLNKEDLPLEMNGRMNFAEFMKSGYEGFVPTLDDYILQANLCFPEVRLNKFIEIRNHDCVPTNIMYGVLALYKGLLYDNSAMVQVEDLMRGFRHLDYSEVRYEIPRNAMQSHIKGIWVRDIVKELIDIAEQALGEEKKYLLPLRECVNRGMTLSDEIIKNWYGTWDKDFKKFLRYLVKQSN